MASEVAHLMANAIHPSEASDVHDGIFSTPVGIYSTPREAPDLHDEICRPLDGKCNTPMRLLKFTPVMASAVHLMENAVHLFANAVHPSEAPDVHDGTL